MFDKNTKLPVLETACGCNIRKTSLFIGIISTFFSTFFLLGAVICLIDFEINFAKKFADDADTEVLELDKMYFQRFVGSLYFIVGILLSGTAALFSVLLLIGVWKKRPSFFQPWFYMIAVFMAIYFGLAFFKAYFLYEGLSGSVFHLIVDGAIIYYALAIVHSYYVQITAERFGDNILGQQILTSDSLKVDGDIKPTSKSVV